MTNKPLIILYIFWLLLGFAAFALASGGPGPPTANLVCTPQTAYSMMTITMDASGSGNSVTFVEYSYDGNNGDYETNTTPPDLDADVVVGEVVQNRVCQIRLSGAGGSDTDTYEIDLLSVYKARTGHKRAKSGGK